MLRQPFSVLETLKVLAYRRCNIHRSFDRVSVEIIYVLMNRVIDRSTIYFPKKYVSTWKMVRKNSCETVLKL